MGKRAIELFAGVGGFRVGLNSVTLNHDVVEEKENFKFVWANQWEPATKTQDAFNCYVKRFGKDSCVNEDISKIDKNSIPDHDLLTGGFPCQDYSVARSLQNEKGIEGKKGVLWWQIRDILESLKDIFSGKKSSKDENIVDKKLQEIYKVEKELGVTANIANLTKELEMREIPKKKKTSRNTEKVTKINNPVKENTNLKNNVEMQEVMQEERQD